MNKNKLHIYLFRLFAACAVCKHFHGHQKVNCLYTYIDIYNKPIRLHTYYMYVCVDLNRAYMKTLY